MALDKIAKISFAVSLAEHVFILGMVGVIVSVPAAKYIPMIEVDMLNNVSLKDLLTAPVDTAGDSKGPTETKPETPKNAVTPNVTKPGDNTKLAPAEVGTTQEGSISSTLDMVGSGLAENVRFSGGKVAGFSFTGTGIVTAKPDNVFVQFMVKSGLQGSLRSAENEALKKVDFMTYNLGRLFKIKKESIKVYGFEPEMIQQTIRQARTLQQRDSDGNVVAKVEFKYNTKKYVVVGDLGSKSFLEICELLDKAVDYGGIAVAEIPKMGNEASAESVAGSAGTQMTAVKGATKLKFSSTTNNPNNKLINYHFNEATLEKLIKSSKDQAYKEAKDKVEKIRAVLKFKENEMDINFKENINAVSDEEGGVTIKTEVTATLNKSRAPAAAAEPAPAAPAEE